MNAFSYPVVQPRDQSRVDELHRLIEDAEARVREVQTEGTERAAERARLEWELGAGAAMPYEPPTHSVLARLYAIRLELARKPGSPKQSDAEAALARREAILRGGIGALSMAVPGMATRMADAEHELSVLRDELVQKEVLITDMAGANRPQP